MLVPNKKPRKSRVRLERIRLDWISVGSDINRVEDKWRVVCRERSFSDSLQRYLIRKSGQTGYARCERKSRIGGCWKGEKNKRA